MGKSVAGAAEGQVASSEEGATFSVCVRFRRSRLKLARRIATLSEAVAFADGVRRDRFHSPEDVFVVDERTGLIVNEQGEGVGEQAQGGALAGLGELSPSRDDGAAEATCLEEIFDHADRAIDAARRARERHAAALDAILAVMRESAVCDPAALARVERDARSAHKQVLRSFDDMGRAVAILRRFEEQRAAR